MGLDVRTLYLINAAVLFLSAATAYYFWRQYRDNTWLLWWCLGTLGAGTSLMTLVLFGPAPPVSIGASAVVLLFASYVVTWESMRRLNGRPVAPTRIALFVVAFAVVFVAAISLGADRAQRASVLSIGLTICALLSAWELLRGRKDELTAGRLVMAALFLVNAAVLVVRGALTWFRPSSPTAQTYYDPLQGIVPLVNSIGVVCLSIGLIMMANERASGRHRKLALTDDLTGLPNRRYFLDQTGRLARRAQREGRPSAVLMMDLDNFSRINEQFGHAGGDEALASFANLLRTQLRARDIVARYGGEEFCAFLDGVGADQAARVAEAVRTRLATQPIDIRGERHRITVSIGVASVQGDDVLAALQKADESLYEAKAQGRDRVVCLAGRQPARPAHALLDRDRLARP